ncbi:hypothetical protein Q0N30_16785 [Priestia megaterium]|uniref:hypothetical protein n=1 Tax=Priestia megaterium TaxID=1404 RepID=UPI0034578166
MKRTISFLSVVYLTVLTACNQESTGTNKESSAVIVVVENKEYNGTEDMDPFVDTHWKLDNLNSYSNKKRRLY